MTGGLLQRTTDEVEDLGGDLLLTAFVVLKGEFLQEVVAVVGGKLHSYGACGVLGGGAVQQGGEYAKTDYLREEGVYQGFGGWLDDQIGGIRKGVCRSFCLGL